VYAVELPGHDLAAEREPFAPIEQVVEQVVAEIVRQGLTNVMLWGHSSGTAPAVATARALEARGVPVRRVFLGAQLLGDADRRRAAVAELAAVTDADIAARLAADGGYTALGELDVPRAEQVGAAYRHDCVSAHHSFLDLLDTPPAKLAAPVTVVVAADDPSTSGYTDRHAEWQLLTDDLELHEIPDGGHYFLRTRPAETAEAVLRHTQRPIRPRRAGSPSATLGPRLPGAERAPPDIRGGRRRARLAHRPDRRGPTSTRGPDRSAKETRTA
jgi:surfactin synthase thioesterase subunit